MSRYVCVCTGGVSEQRPPAVVNGRAGSGHLPVRDDGELDSGGGGLTMCRTVERDMERADTTIASLLEQMNDIQTVHDSVTGMHAIDLTSGVTMGWLLRLVTGAPLVLGGRRQFYFILNQRGGALTQESDGGASGGCVTPLDLTTVAAVVAVFTVVYRRQSVGARKLGPDLS